MGAYNNQFKRAADGRHPTQNGHRSQSSATDYVRGNSLFSRIDILTVLSVHYLLDATDVNCEHEDYRHYMRHFTYCLR